MVERLTSAMQRFTGLFLCLTPMRMIVWTIAGAVTHSRRHLGCLGIAKVHNVEAVIIGSMGVHAAIELNISRIVGKVIR